MSNARHKDDIANDRIEIRQCLRSAKWHASHWVGRYVYLTDDIPPGLLWRCLQIVQMQAVVRQLEEAKRIQNPTPEETKQIDDEIQRLIARITYETECYEADIEYGDSSRRLVNMLTGFDEDGKVIGYTRLRVQS